jgi:hypothetical protein
MQTRSHGNRSLHWTHQFAMVEKVITPSKELIKPQKTVDDLQLIELLGLGFQFNDSLYFDT